MGDHIKNALQKMEGVVVSMAEALSEEGNSEDEISMAISALVLSPLLNMAKDAAEEEYKDDVSMQAKVAFDFLVRESLLAVNRGIIDPDVSGKQAMATVELIIEDYNVDKTVH